MRFGVDEEWYWLREIANKIDEPSVMDIWTLAISAFTALATLAIGGLAAYIAWKAHKLSTQVRAESKSKQDLEERLSVVESLEAYVMNVSRQELGKPNDGPAAAERVLLRLQRIGIANDDAGVLILRQRARAFRNAVRAVPAGPTKQKTVVTLMTEFMNTVTAWLGDPATLK